MLISSRKLLLVLSFGVGAFALPMSSAQDEKKPGVVKKEGDKPADEKSDAKPSGPPSKMPEFSKQYASEGEVSGVVSAADQDSVTIRANFRVPTGGGNGKSRNVRTKEEHQDFTFKYAEGGMARTKVTPMKADDKGKFVKLPFNELEPLKKPSGAPGWHVEKSEIKGGSIVTLELVRPKSISASKVTLEDKVIKFAIITGETTPPKVSKNEADEIKKKEKK